ncbi:STAS domain-containing protein [Nocardia sp. NPDC004604]|uniref:STAS domain-containing protein n=1 Tax=Nocardia sp. NPDC004604 TaxID=3157013 RepID=UPI0033B55A42
MPIVSISSDDSTAPVRESGQTAERLSIVVLPPMDSITLCAVGGEVDYLTADTLRRSLVGALPTAGAVVVIDLSQVTFFGVAGLRVLMDARSWCAHSGRRLQLITGPRCVDRLLEVAGHAAVFDIVPSLAAVARATAFEVARVSA